ncbi:MAG: sulfur modification protein DndD [Thermosipho sp. (in: thermotogales)]|jgi:DNA sulfur modification protein DndD|nr:sulfur modification protein DndD [Thermosipho sp. (in: thermotogales)]
MIVLRIERIKLSKFKQFKDFRIEFDKNNNQNNDFHIIVAKMGVGKSNLLESINWCLYGKEIFGKITSPTDKDVLNNNCLNEDGEHIVKVNLNLSDEKANYLVLRESKFKVVDKKAYSLNEHHFSFSKEMEIILKDIDAKKEIENLLPEDLRDHFFFNGERLDNYFDENQGAKISHVIKKMSGLDILENFKDTLEKIKSKYLKKIKVTQSNIDKKKELEKKLDRIKDNKKEAEKLLQNQILDLEKTKKRLEDVKLKLDKLKEYEVYKDQIENLKSWIQELESRKSEILERKAQIIFELSTLIFGWSAIEKVYHENKDIEINYDFLPPEIIRAALNENKCPICEKELDENHRKTLEKYLSLDKDFIISVKEYNDLINRIEELEKERKYLNKQIGEILTKLRETRNKLKSVERNISEIQAEELNRLYNEKKELENQIETINQKIGEFNKQIEFFEKEEKEIERELGELAIDDSNKIFEKIKFVELLQQIITNTIINRREEIKKEILDYIKEYLEKLMWKKDLVSDVEFSPNFSLEVYDKYRNKILNRLSGGEKSVLTLSFALAMHKASGVDAPIIIDRPLANISGDTYDKLIEMFSKISEEKQIIIMITDREYQQSVELLNKLATTIHILEMSENSDVKIADKYVKEVI